MSKFCFLALRRWQNFVLYRRQRHTSKSLAYRHYLHVLQSKAIGAWKLTVKTQQAELKAQHEISQALMKAVMVFWREYHALYAIKKKKERRALLHRKRREQKLGKAIFAFLREQMIWRRRVSHFERILASRRHRLSLINALHRWMHATFDHLLTANVKFQKELLEAQAQCEAQQDQTAAVDVENLQLIDRLHSMSSEIAMLKITITEKEKQEEDIHRALEDGMTIENSMREELDKQHLKIEDLEQTASRLQKQLMTQNAEDSAEETHHSMEIESLQWAIKDSQAQLKEKTSQIEYYEKALKVTADRLEGTSGESQEQLNHAFQIAANLRRLLEDRESQFATLEGNCRRKELELEELQRKLAQGNSTFSESLESRDTRIRELEHLLALKQSEVQESQEELQDLQGALDIKDGHVRRLEYEMKLKSERESQRTKVGFMSTMSSWSSSAAQIDGVAGFRSSMHSIQMESMRHVYMQSNSPAPQAPTQEECVSSYSLPSINLQAKPYTYSKDTGNLQELQSGSCLELRGDEKSLQSHNSGSGFQDYYQESERHLYSSGRAEGTERLSNCGSSPRATYGGHTYTNSDRESPKAHGGLSEASKRAIAQESMYSGCDSKERNAENIALALAPGHGPLQASHTAVDSLHDEIQQLQARIMSRLRDGPGRQEGWRDGHGAWN